MLCQECNQREATVHFTKIVNGDKKEVHLCEPCARDKGDFMMKDISEGFAQGFGQGFPQNFANGFSFNNLLGSLLGFEPGKFGGATGNSQTQQTGQRCDTCGLSYQQFAQVGRFGCAECYHHFANRLEPMIRRIHGGATHHTGKVPQRTGGLIRKKKEIDNLRRDLQTKIQQEQFEEAAVLRDRIRQLEQDLERESNPSQGEV
ncbi:MAG TPA: UvrB/UvrC motif-containing protein [Bacilli bacterium]|nr:UvrB/UvrC motif-containing protein [Bacilli bacterium]